MMIGTRTTVRKQPRIARWCRRAVGRLAGSALVLTACATGPGADSFPPDVPDPATVKSPVGAMDFYRLVVRQFPVGLDQFVMDVGVLTDELEATPTPILQTGMATGLDSRHTLASVATDDHHYDRFHALRAQAREARGLLATYAPDSSSALVGHMYAVEGYAEIFLADLFCSGIPLSTVDFGADYTLRPGSTTAEVYTHAADLLDTAMELSGDRPDIHSLAAVGRGRALLAVGDYAAAAAAVAAVPDDYRYHAEYARAPLQDAVAVILSGYAVALPGVGDREGINGLDYRTSEDPRVPVQVVQTTSGADALDVYGNRLFYPAKYPLTGSLTLVHASGVEARLIEAEAALHTGSAGWLAALNALRTDGTFELQGDDTLWHAGSGGVPGLRPLEDPGTVNAAVDLVFRERAFWLYLTGHRQGDLRRLIRGHSGRSVQTVYPAGTYHGGLGSYSTQVTFPVPASEQTNNPNYNGCFHRSP